MGKGTFQEHTRMPVTFGDAPSVGDMTWIDKNTGLIYNYDDTRSVWLSAAKHTFEFARKGSAKGMYLPLLGDLDDSDDVYMAGKQAVIVSVFCRSKWGDDSAGFEIRKNENIIYEFYYDGYGSKLYVNSSLNFNIDSYDKIQVYVKKAGSGVINTVCRIETAWGYDI
jgi:hypothetical protein